MRKALAAVSVLAASVVLAGAVAARSGAPERMTLSAEMKGHGDKKMNHGGMPKHADTATTKLSQHKHFKVTITPRKHPVVINALHSWVLHVTTPKGKPVPGAKVKVAGRMPAHGHGLPTAPRVTKYLGDGKYLVEGMKFNMAGWWELKFAIDGAGRRDSVTFNLAIK